MFDENGYWICLDGCPCFCLCKRGFICDCETGEIICPPDYESDIGSATVEEMRLQNGE